MESSLADHCVFSKTNKARHFCSILTTGNRNVTHSIRKYLSGTKKLWKKIMPSSRRWCQTPISNKHRWRSADEGFKRICRVILKHDQSVAILNKSRTYGNCNLRHLMWKVSWLKNAALNKSHGLWSPNGQEPGFKVTNAHILTRLTHSSQRYCLLWTKSSRIEVNIRKIFSKVWHTSNYW